MDLNLKFYVFSLFWAKILVPRLCHTDDNSSGKRAYLELPSYLSTISSKTETKAKISRILSF
jgi:hypothetical protein